MKKAIAALLILAVMAGCHYDKAKEKSLNVVPVSTNQAMSIDFNQEHYVWEYFYFPTNRTTGK